MVRFLALVNTKAVIRFVRIFSPIPQSETEFDLWLASTVALCLSNDKNKVPVMPFSIKFPRPP